MASNGQPGFVPVKFHDAEAMTFKSRGELKGTLENRGEGLAHNRVPRSTAKRRVRVSILEPPSLSYIQTKIPQLIT